MILIPQSLEKCVLVCRFCVTSVPSGSCTSTNLIHNLIALTQLPLTVLPYTDFLHSIHRLGRISNESIHFRGSSGHFVIILFFRWGVVTHTTYSQAGGPPLVGCLSLLIQYIGSYLPYLEAVSSLHKLRIRHAVVTRGPPNKNGDTMQTT
jgi:hypothetical protein